MILGYPCGVLYVQLLNVQLPAGNCLFVQDHKGSDSPLCQHPREQGLLANAYPSMQDWPVAPQ